MESFTRSEGSEGATANMLQTCHKHTANMIHTRSHMLQTCYKHTANHDPHTFTRAPNTLQLFHNESKASPKHTLHRGGQPSSSKGSDSSPSKASFPRFFTTILEKWPNTAQTLRRRFVRRACSTTLLHLSTANAARCFEGQRPMMCYKLFKAEMPTDATHGRGSIKEPYRRAV